MNYRLVKTKRRKRQFVLAAAFLAVLGAGWWYPLLGFFIPFCMLLGIIIGLFRGWKWCDWMCPRGSFLDSLVARVSPSREIPSFFMGLPLRLTVMILLMTVMSVQLIHRWPKIHGIGSFFIVMLASTTSMAVVLALFVHPRAWCCVCPVGSLANWTGHGKYSLRIDSNRCTECGLCRKVCPIDLSPFNFKGEGVEAVWDGDCLKCGQCVTDCPTGALSLGKE